MKHFGYPHIRQVVNCRGYLRFIAHPLRVSSQLIANIRGSKVTGSPVRTNLGTGLSQFQFNVGAPKRNLAKGRNVLPIAVSEEVSSKQTLRGSRPGGGRPTRSRG